MRRVCRPRWYSASDFFFFPSRYEGFGLALLEALSCDLPAIVSKSAWPFAEGPEQCGIVVDGNSEGGFVRAIRSVLSNRRNFSPRDFVLPRYDREVFADRWRAFIQGVLEAN